VTVDLFLCILMNSYYTSREGTIRVATDHMYEFILVRNLHTFITYCNALMTRHGFCINIYLFIVIYYFLLFINIYLT
jgi:hypothetical protein